MKAQILKNGALKITASNEDRQELKYQYNRKNDGGYLAAEGFVADSLWDEWAFVPPDSVAALTDAPIITNDLTIADNGDVEYVGDVWWFPNYMIEDPWEILKNTGRVIFEPEENNKSLPKEQGKDKGGKRHGS